MEKDLVRNGVEGNHNEEQYRPAYMRVCVRSYPSQQRACSWLERYTVIMDRLSSEEKFREMDNEIEDRRCSRNC